MRPGPLGQIALGTVLGFVAYGAWFLACGAP
jgi:hypothetical protein